MPRHELPVVPLVTDRCRPRSRALDAAGVGDVAGLDAVDAEPLVEVERGAELLFVAATLPPVSWWPIRCTPASSHRRRPPRGRSPAYASREAEVAPVREPVAVPAAVPALDQDAAEAVGGGEVDVALRVRGGRAVLRARAPGLLSRCSDHQMPTYLNGLNQDTSPSAFGSLRLRIRSDIVQPGGVGRDLDRAPRRGERRGALHRRACRGRRQRRLQPLSRAAPAQPHR